MRQMVRVCQQNQLPYRYVLADSWFSAKDNLTFIRQTLHKHFVVRPQIQSDGRLELCTETARELRAHRCL